MTRFWAMFTPRAATVGSARRVHTRGTDEIQDGLRDLLRLLEVQEMPQACQRLAVELGLEIACLALGHRVRDALVLRAVQMQQRYVDRDTRVEQRLAQARTRGPQRSIITERSGHARCETSL